MCERSGDNEVRNVIGRDCRCRIFGKGEKEGLRG